MSMNKGGAERVISILCNNGLGMDNEMHILTCLKGASQYILKDDVIRVFEDTDIKVLTNDLVMYEFNILVDDEIQRIEIISNDEKITYAVINGASLQVGKLYKITQYVEIN